MLDSQETHQCCSPSYPSRHGILRTVHTERPGRRACSFSSDPVSQPVGQSVSQSSHPLRSCPGIACQRLLPSEVVTVAAEP
ncbi:hypothetical protein EYF80_041272 [Liparis tanakae]|uniref:Uncharacterized protein n=1 Tax=Liparis tanakae TaxID=230148 RepID=A0A4Z2G4R0_9TELE|nr:hypothetical protein EYF80_041272 [Liparis tanakae]